MQGFRKWLHPLDQERPLGSFLVLAAEHRCLLLCDDILRKFTLRCCKQTCDDVAFHQMLETFVKPTKYWKAYVNVLKISRTPKKNESLDRIFV